MPTIRQIPFLFASPNYPVAWTEEIQKRQSYPLRRGVVSVTTERHCPPRRIVVTVKFDCFTSSNRHSSSSQQLSLATVIGPGCCRELGTTWLRGEHGRGRWQC